MTIQVSSFVNYPNFEYILDQYMWNQSISIYISTLTENYTTTTNNQQQQIFINIFCLCICLDLIYMNIWLSNLIHLFIFVSSTSATIWIMSSHSDLFTLFKIYLNSSTFLKSPPFRTIDMRLQMHFGDIFHTPNCECIYFFFKPTPQPCTIWTVVVICL